MASIVEGRMERTPTAPSDGPCAKRPRLSQGQANDDENRGPPAEIWGKVMEFLPLGSVLSSAVVSRDMLRATSFVKIIHVDRSSQMRAVVASRHAAVVEVHISSLFSVVDYDEQNDAQVMRVDKVSSEVMVLFLSMFAKLRNVAFDPPSKLGEHYYEHSFHEDNDEIDYQPNPDGGSIASVIDSFSRAYRRGFISSGVRMLGLSCPESHNGVEGWLSYGCETCRNACRNFPLEHVVDFECHGSSLMKVAMKRPHGLDVCMTRKRLDDTIKDRPGCEEVLYSKDRILTLLGAGSRYTLTLDDDGRTLEIVQFSGEELQHLQNATESSPHDFDKLPSKVVYDAISGSFVKDEHDTARPTNIFYLAKKSYDYLKDEVGLQLDEDIFYGCTRDFEMFLPQIAKAFDDQSDGYLVACVRMMRHLVESEGSCIIQPAMVSGIIKKIAAKSWCNVSVPYEVVQLFNLLLEQSEEFHVMLKEQPTNGLVAKILVQLAGDCSRVEAVELGIHMLHQHFFKKNVRTVIQLKYVSVLETLLESTTVAISDLAIQSLGDIVDIMAQTDTSPCKALFGATFLLRLLRKMEYLTNKNTSILRTATRILMLLSTRSFHHHLCFYYDLDCAMWTLSKLLQIDDDVVSRNSSIAIMNILKENTKTEYPSRFRINSREVELKIFHHFGKLATNPLVQDVVLEGLYWLTKGRSFDLEGITDALPHIKAHVASANEAAALHTCRTVYNIMDLNKSNQHLLKRRVQIVLDSGVVPFLNEALRDLRASIRKEAMQCIWQISKNGTPPQHSCLVAQGCIGTVCDIIINDDALLVTRALMAMRNILTAKENKTACSNEAQAAISLFLVDAEGIDHQQALLQSFKKVHPWVVVETKKKEAQICHRIRDSLERQQKEVQLQISCSGTLVGGSRSPGKGILKNRLVEFKAEFDEVDAECRLKEEELARLTREADKFAPKEEWQGRSGKDGLPGELDALERAIKETEQRIEELSSGLNARKKVVATAVLQLKGLLQGM
ncbi:hypothetical protein ACHAWF_012269 [Thalassiosira exigua]